MPTLTAMTWIVTDPERTASFYAALGIPVTPPHPNDPAYHLHLGGVLVQLWPASPAHPAMTGLTITLTVAPAVRARWGAGVDDPDGNRVVLFAGDVLGDII